MVERGQVSEGLLETCLINYLYSNLIKVKRQTTMKSTKFKGSKGFVIHLNRKAHVFQTW